jgi:hypothetical protein
MLIKLSFTKEIPNDIRTERKVENRYSLNGISPFALFALSASIYAI